MNCVAPVKGAPFKRTAAPPFVERYKLNATSDGSVPSTRQLTRTCVALVRSATTPRPRFSINDGGRGEGSASGGASALVRPERLISGGWAKTQNIATAKAPTTIDTRFVSLIIFADLTQQGIGNYF